MAIQEGHIIGINKTTSGDMYRVLLNSYDPNTRKWTFARSEVPEAVLIRTLASGKVHLCNAELSAGKLKGTTGSLSRFNPANSKFTRPIVILSELRTDDAAYRLLGYKIVTYDGKVRNIKVQELLDYCSNIAKMAAKYNGYAVPIQNAIYVEETPGVAAHIKGYIQNQFLVEDIHVSKPSNVEPAKVDQAANKKQVSRLEELFTKDQIEELRKGRESGVNYKLYGNNKLSAAQMKEIRKSLEAGINPKLYADPAFKPETMKAYRIQAKYGVDISQFINPSYNPEQIYELSTALISGVDISKLAYPKKSANDMAKERIEMESKIWNETSVSVIDIIKTFHLDD